MDDSRDSLDPIPFFRWNERAPAQPQLVAAIVREMARALHEGEDKQSADEAVIAGQMPLPQFALAF